MPAPMLTLEHQHTGHRQNARTLLATRNNNYQYDVFWGIRFAHASQTATLYRNISGRNLRKHPALPMPRPDNLLPMVYRHYLHPVRHSPISITRANHPPRALASFLGRKEAPRSLSPCFIIPWASTSVVGMYISLECRIG